MGGWWGDKQVQMNSSLVRFVPTSNDESAFLVGLRLLISHPEMSGPGRKCLVITVSSLKEFKCPSVDTEPFFSFLR